MRRALLFIGLLSLACLCSPANCWLFHVLEPSAPDRDFTMDDLLIDLSVFPPRWYVDPPPGPAPDDDYIRQIDDTWIGFTADSPSRVVAAHRVYRFGASWKAAAEYDHQLPRQFNSNSMFSLTPWATPDELPYESVVADQSHFACHLNGVGTPAIVCKQVGQYQEYLVIFHTVMDSEHMTYANLERILVAIDERMALYLGKEME